MKMVELFSHAMEKGGKSENDRVVSPKNVGIRLNESYKVTYSVPCHIDAVIMVSRHCNKIVCGPGTSTNEIASFQSHDVCVLLQIENLFGDQSYLSPNLCFGQ